MRRVAYALMASLALMVGATASVSAGCYGECNGYRDYRNTGPSYDRYERPVYREPAYERYSEGPRYHTTYYVRGPEIPVSYNERPAYDDGYDGGYNGGYSSYNSGYSYGSRYSYDGYYDRPYRRYYGGGYYDRPYYRGYGYGYGYGSYSPTIRLGGAWEQTGPFAGWGGYGGYGYSGYGRGWGATYAGGWGGCHTAYIPYGWTWYKARSC